MVDYLTIVGYVSGSDLNIYDEAYGKDEEHDFDRILTDAVNKGAVPIWESHKIFVIHDMVFASVIVNLENSADDYCIPIMNFSKTSAALDDSDREKAVNNILSKMK
jgi:hypothetical protein